MHPLTEEKLQERITEIMCIGSNIASGRHERMAKELAQIAEEHYGRI